MSNTAGQQKTAGMSTGDEMLFKTMYHVSFFDDFPGPWSLICQIYILVLPANDMFDGILLRITIISNKWN